MHHALYDANTLFESFWAFIVSNVAQLGHQIECQLPHAKNGKANTSTCYEYQNGEEVNGMKNNGPINSSINIGDKHSLIYT